MSVINASCKLQQLLNYYDFFSSTRRAKQSCELKNHKEILPLGVKILKMHLQFVHFLFPLITWAYLWWTFITGKAIATMTSIMGACKNTGSLQESIVFLSPSILVILRLSPVT